MVLKSPDDPVLDQDQGDMQMMTMMMTIQLWVLSLNHIMTPVIPIMIPQEFLLVIISQQGKYRRTFFSLEDSFILFRKNVREV